MRVYFTNVELVLSQIQFDTNLSTTRSEIAGSQSLVLLHCLFVHCCDFQTVSKYS